MAGKINKADFEEYLGGAKRKKPSIRDIIIDDGYNEGGEEYLGGAKRKKPSIRDLLPEGRMEPKYSRGGMVSTKGNGKAIRTKKCKMM